jgi:4-hydroxy-3-methylbut-2-enyl diphosphate reductase
VERLEKIGLKIITHDEFFTLSDCKVLIRSHGEPPETYDYAWRNNIELIDATCPVVLKLQKKISGSHNELNLVNGQIVIYGKKGHAEVTGLNGQTGHTAIIIENKEDINQIDFSRPITLYAQTTKSLTGFKEIADTITRKAFDKSKVQIKDTICRQVSNRGPHLSQFSAQYDVMIFVSGKNSSNGAALFNICKSANPRSHMVSNPEEINIEWFKDAASVGISGATSTPKWQLEKMADFIDSQTQ